MKAPVSRCLSSSDFLSIFGCATAVPKVICPVQDNEKQLVVYVEVNPLLPDSPQQDFVLLLEQRVFSEDGSL
jgi:hypothetical protein